jgi:putative colanic acid biosynthesis UDP-glucose lipid carrier transferase
MDVASLPRPSELHLKPTPTSWPRSGLHPAPGARDLAEPRDTRVADSKAKRALDIAVSAAALVFLAPLLLVIAAAVWVESPGPILFRQHRTGYAGRVFSILKFRSMTVQEDGDRVAQARQGDLRVTRVGAVLRKLSFDELPQLINVLRGEMSLVGPRPHAVAHDRQFRQWVPNYAKRFAARPGITGLAQVNGLRGEIVRESSIILRAAADIRYIETWSLRRDIWILVRTALLVLRDPAAF